MTYQNTTCSMKVRKSYVLYFQKGKQASDVLCHLVGLRVSLCPLSSFASLLSHTLSLSLFMSLFMSLFPHVFSLLIFVFLLRLSLPRLATISTPFCRMPVVCLDTIVYLFISSFPNIHKSIHFILIIKSVQLILLIMKSFEKATKTFGDLFQLVSASSFSFLFSVVQISLTKCYHH